MTLCSKQGLRFSFSPPPFCFTHTSIKLVSVDIKRRNVLTAAYAIYILAGFVILFIRAKIFLHHIFFLPLVIYFFIFINLFCFNATS